MQTTIIDTTAENVPTAHVPGTIHQRPSAATSEFARQRLAQVVSEGARRASGTIKRIFEEVPQDALVRANALNFNVTKSTVGFAVSDSTGWYAHNNAYRQLLERAGIPKPYADTLRESEWGSELLAHTLREHYAHDDARYLVRSVEREARGVLSDSFRRLDSRPLLEAFVKSAMDLNAVPYEGAGSVIKAEVRMVLPQIVEPVPGEGLVFGVTWRNSDYGAGKFDLSVFVLRLYCLNGAVGASALSKVHLGGRFGDSLEFSQETYDQDTKTLASATRDIVKGALGPASIERHVEAIRAANSKEGSFTELSSDLVKRLTKTELKSVKDAFEGPDVINLPPGNTAWRMSNALSWIANATDDGERKLELQALAGKVFA